MNIYYLVIFQFPVSLAINLSVHKDKLISNTHKSHVSVKASQTDDKNKGGLSDEVDTSRTHKRFKLYEESVIDFVDYFKQSDRLLTVDTSCGKPDIVWESEGSRMPNWCNKRQY